MMMIIIFIFIFIFIITFQWSSFLLLNKFICIFFILLLFFFFYIWFPFFLQLLFFYSFPQPFSINKLCLNSAGGDCFFRHTTTFRACFCTCTWRFSDRFSLTVFAPFVQHTLEDTFSFFFFLLMQNSICIQRSTVPMSHSNDFTTVLLTADCC